MQQTESPSDRRGLDLRAALIIAGLVVIASGLLVPLARWASPGDGTVPLVSSDGRLYYLVALLVALGAGILVQYRGLPDVRRQKVMFNPELGRARVWSGSTVWVLPAVFLIGLYGMLAIYNDWRYALAVVLAAGASTLAVMAGRSWLEAELTAGDGSLGRARLVHLILTDAAAFVALGMIYLPRSRTLFLVSAAFLVAALLLYQLTEGMYGSPGQRLLYALAGALILAELFWALNYWDIAWYFAGSLTVIALHPLARIISLQLNTGVQRREVAEYAGLGGALFIMIGLLAQ